MTSLTSEMPLAPGFDIRLRIHSEFPRGPELQRSGYTASRYRCGLVSRLRYARRLSGRPHEAQTTYTGITLHGVFHFAHGRFFLSRPDSNESPAKLARAAGRELHRPRFPFPIRRDTA